jgi:hypothetical protein
MRHNQRGRLNVTARGESGDQTAVLAWGLILLIFLAWAALVPLRIVQRLGLRDSPAEVLLGGPPDGPAAEVLMQRAQASGLATRGVRVHILTLADSGERVAFTELDASEGYRWERLLDWEEVREVLTHLAAAADDLDLHRQALVYIGDHGKPILTLAVPQHTMEVYLRGHMTSEALLLSLRLDVDLRLLAEEEAR